MPRIRPGPPATAPPPTAARLPIAVDVVALTVADGALRVLLVDRLLEPYAGRPALPGGFLLDGEDVAGAAVRELTEETGVAPRGHLEQLRTYGPVGRDPRGPVLSVAHLLFSPVLDLPRAGGDAAAVRWAPVGPFLEGGAHLAFDHDRILADGVERARAKIEYSPLATAFCPEEFTIAELRRVYEAVWGTRLDPRNFHRKATRSEGFLQATGRVRSEGVGRPAALFRRPPGSGPTAAEVVEGVTASNAAARGEGGLGSIGLVVGATVGEAVSRLGIDLLRANGPLLAPGVGAQGAGATELESVFGPARRHVLASTSRGVLKAGPSIEALRAAALAATHEAAAALR